MFSQGADVGLVLLVGDAKRMVVPIANTGENDSWNIIVGFCCAEIDELGSDRLRPRKLNELKIMVSDFKDPTASLALAYNQSACGDGAKDFAYFEVFGCARVTIGRDVISLSSASAIQLAALLAVRRTWQPRAALAAYFSLDRADQANLCNIRNLLCKLERELPMASIETAADLVRWRVASDLDRFDVALAQGAWSYAIELGEAQLLMGMEVGASSSYVDWLLSERDLCGQRWQYAVRSELRSMRYQSDARCQLAARWLSRYPFSEQAARALILALLEIGERAHAVSTYDSFAVRMSREMNSQPSGELSALFEPEIKHFLLESFEPAELLPSRSLPEEVFVGRVLEQRSLHAALDNILVRLISVCGIGGVGKTRLVRKVFESRESRRGLQLWLAASHLSTTNELLFDLALALGIDARQRVVGIELIRTKLRGTPCCLYIDGVEQLRGLKELLLELGSACPLLKIITTSRHRSGCHQEWLLLLEGPPLPDSDDREASVLLANDSVRIFLDSARCAGTPLDLGMHSETVVALVLLVEGLPLALQLMATVAYVAPLPVLLAEFKRAVILGEDSQFTCVNAVMRQLATSVARSIGMISYEQRLALVSLAVFPAEFSLDAAVALAALPSKDLFSLVGKSLVRLSDLGKVSLHPAVRAWGVAHAHEVPLAHDAFLNYFVHRLWDLQYCGRRWSVIPVRRFIRGEWSNVVYAWEIACRRGRHDALTVLAEALFEHGSVLETACDLYPLFAAGLSSIEQGGDGTRTLRALLHAGLALCEHGRHDYSLAVEHANAAREAASLSLDRCAWRISSQVTASLYMAPTRLEEAKCLVELAQCLSDAMEDDRFAVSVLRSNAMLACHVGHFDRAFALFDKLTIYLRRVEDAPAELQCLLFKSATLADLGDLKRALDAQQGAEALIKAERVPVFFEAEVLCLGAWILCEMKDLAQARRLLDRANALASEGRTSGGCGISLLQCNCFLKIAEKRTGDALLLLPSLLLSAIRSGSAYLLGKALILAAKWFRLAGDEASCRTLLSAVVASSAPECIRVCASKLSGHAAHDSEALAIDLTILAADIRLAL